MDPIVISRVRLREIAQDDLPRMYEFNLDPEANRLAATILRSAKAFEAHWENALADSNGSRPTFADSSKVPRCVCSIAEPHSSFRLMKAVLFGSGISSAEAIFNHHCQVCRRTFQKLFSHDWPRL